MKTGSPVQAKNLCLNTARSGQGSVKQGIRSGFRILHMDLDIVRKITGSTIKSIYPRYYPAGAVEFFLMHHSDEHIVTDISDGRVYVLYEGGEPVGTVTISDNNIGL